MCFEVILRPIVTFSMILEGECVIPRSNGSAVVVGREEAARGKYGVRFRTECQLAF